MRMRMEIITLLTVIMLAAAPLTASTPDRVKSAREFVAMLSRGEFKTAVSTFDAAMKRALSEEKLHELWVSLVAQAGQFEKELADSTSQFQDYYIVFVTCKFQKATIDVKIVFNQAGEMAGLFFLPRRVSELVQPEGPSKPYPYESNDVTFENAQAKIRLAGTLTMPGSGGPFPAVLLIPGSGPHDRDETISGHKIFLILADYLTRRGIAVLRVDDRGVGMSTGDFKSATTMDLASDALAGVNYLTTHKEINSREIGLVGHSEGGLIAPIVADESSNVAFIVLMAPPGLPGEDIVLSQVDLLGKANGLSDSLIEINRRIEKKLLDVVTTTTEKDSSEVRAKLKEILERYIANSNHAGQPEHVQAEAVIDAQLNGLLSPWYRFFLTYDPRPALQKVKCPVLALWGTKDLQVPPSENLPAVEKALQDGGNKDFKVVELLQLNHLFQTAETGSPSEYAKIQETISPKALDVIAKWILKRTAE